jgi:hypothetical protein
MEETKICSIRGIICGACNRALGHAKESKERLQSLIDYLTKFEEV